MPSPPSLAFSVLLHLLILLGYVVSESTQLPEYSTDPSAEQELVSTTLTELPPPEETAEPEPLPEQTAEPVEPIDYAAQAKPAATQSETDKGDGPADEVESDDFHPVADATEESVPDEELSNAVETDLDGYRPPGLKFRGLTRDVADVLLSQRRMKLAVSFSDGRNVLIDGTLSQPRAVRSPAADDLRDLSERSVPISGIMSAGIRQALISNWGFSRKDATSAVITLNLTTRFDQQILQAQLKALNAEQRRNPSRVDTIVSLRIADGQVLVDIAQVRPR